MGSFQELDRTPPFGFLPPYPCVLGKQFNVNIIFGKKKKESSSIELFKFRTKFGCMFDSITQEQK